MDDDFDALVRQLEHVLEQRRATKDKKKRFALAARRYELETALIARLRPQRSEPGAEMRRNVRVPCSFSARVQVADQVSTASVVNISGGGVMLKLPFAVSMRTLIEVIIDPSPGLLEEPLIARGEVAWSKDTQAGIAFHAIDEKLERRLFDVVLKLLRAQPRKVPPA